MTDLGKHFAGFDQLTPAQQDEVRAFIRATPAEKVEFCRRHGLHAQADDLQAEIDGATA